MSSRAASCRFSSSTWRRSGPFLPPMYRHRVSSSSWYSRMSSGSDVAVERERQIHDRKLQPLGHKHRHDLHGGGVAVQAAVCVRSRRCVRRTAGAASPAAPAGPTAPDARSPAAAARCARGRSCAARRRVGLSTRRPMPALARPRTLRPPRASRAWSAHSRSVISNPVGQRVTARRQAFPRSRRRTSCTRPREPARCGAAGRTPPADTASLWRPAESNTSLSPV